MSSSIHPKMDTPPRVRSASDIVVKDCEECYMSGHTDFKSKSASLDDKMAEDEKEYTIFSKCAAEFIAVLLFVYVGSMQAAGVGHHDGVVHAAITHGVAIFVLAATFGGVSGAHVNPAVTVGIAMVGRISAINAISYIAAQLLGSVFGALLVRMSLDFATYSSIAGGATLCAPTTTWHIGLTAEIVTTYILVQTVLMTAVDTDKNRLAPLAIGFSLIIEIMAVGAISGASMNPARSFGPNVLAQIFLEQTTINGLHAFWTFHWIYYLGPVIGACLAAGVYRIFFARDYRLMA